MLDGSVSKAKLEKYNSMEDKHLKGFFQNPVIVDVLKKTGLVNTDKMN